MTHYEILSMTTNSAFDTLFAEKVLKWQFWAEKRENYSSITPQAPGDKEPWTRYQYERHEEMKRRYTKIAAADIDHHKMAVYGVPDFSHDMGKLWPHIDRRKKDLQIFTYIENEEPNFETGWLVKFGGEAVEGVATAPEALMKAMLLKAIKEESV